MASLCLLTGAIAAFAIAETITIWRAWTSQMLHRSRIIHDRLTWQARKVRQYLFLFWCIDEMGFYSGLGAEMAAHQSS
ncbi:hypothetical protein BJ166DRAFT_532739 [Pestalotiopsis sp. NC0098]|nr:hypothetical protein BJ166DRAFT_532739 [Pestalotiopsis sp. NC0098]